MDTPFIQYLLQSLRHNIYYQPPYSCEGTNDGCILLINHLPSEEISLRTGWRNKQHAEGMWGCKGLAYHILSLESLIRERRNRGASWAKESCSSQPSHDRSGDREEDCRTPTKAYWFRKEANSSSYMEGARLGASSRHYNTVRYVLKRYMMWNAEKSNKSVMIRRMYNSTKDSKTGWSYPIGQQCSLVLDQIGHYRFFSIFLIWSEIIMPRTQCLSTARWKLYRLELNFKRTWNTINVLP